LQRLRDTNARSRFEPPEPGRVARAARPGSTERSQPRPRTNDELRDRPIERRELPGGDDRSAAPERRRSNAIPRRVEVERRPGDREQRQRAAAPERSAAPGESPRVRREPSADAIREMYRRAAGRRAVDAPTVRRRSEGAAPKQSAPQRSSPQRESAAPSPGPRSKESRANQGRQSSSGGQRGSSGRKTGKRR
jgi:hypothetical protein